MAIPAGVIFIWNGTNANIPAGWVRETTLDGRFLKGNSSGVDAGVYGGASQHSHSSVSSHNHTMTPHTHQATVGGAYGGQAGTQTNSESTAGLNHTHTGGTTGGSTVTNLSSENITYSLVSNNPPYHEVIFIKPTSNVAGLPENVIGLYQDSDFVNNAGRFLGYYECDGSNSTPNLTNKYLRGAGVGADAGTTGGSTTNVHNLEHTHSVPTHYHFFASGTVNSQLRDSDPGVTNEFSSSHTHGVDLNSVSDTLNAGNPSITCSETVEPLFRKKLAIQQKNTNFYTPTGIIGMWVGTLASIPLSFEYCSCMDDYYLKIANGVGELNNTGGSNTHTHSNNVHTHTGSHNHGNTIVGHVASIDRGSSTTYTWIDSLRGGPVYHAITTDTINTTYTDATTSANSSSNEPEYRTVSFIKMKKKKGSAVAFV